MRIHLFHSPAPTLSRHAGSRTPRSGIALVVVLSFLVIISGLVIAFFSNVATESAGASTSAASASASALSNSAVNLVMAQIVDATKGRTTAGDASTAQAWASQPGAIRTYARDGKPLNVYKLYSDSGMIEAGASFSPDAKELAAWNTPDRASIYTDLNAPIADASGRLNYPIVDPAAEGFVDGFSITASPGYDQSQPDSTSNHRAPMPVRWLYLLEDGTLVPAPDSAENGAIAIPKASATNRIKGRVAFWTDDESSKVNINTASEGVYWDIPRIYSTEDVGLFGSGMTASTPGLALCQPASNEYQRYPGHPATTSLSPIFGKILPIQTPINKSNSAKVDEYYHLSPRVAAGGSKSGTAIPTAKLIPDSDRLYASIDELMFKPLLKPDSGNAPRRIANTSADSKPGVLTREALEKARFFITACSNAPEVTLANTPRIGVWPAHNDPAKRTAYDQVSVFCSTVGNKGYLFTRQNSRSATDDYDGIARNRTLYKYLQALTGQPIPGFGGNFLSKYAADRDQILTSIFDYIRCINLADTSQGATPFTPISTFKVTAPGGGEVIPIRIGNTQGFGRYDSIAEVALLFHGTRQTNSRTDRMKAVLLMEFQSPLQGNVGYQPKLKHRVTGLDKIKLKVNGSPDPQSAFLPASGENYLEVPGVQTWHGRGIGGTEGMNMAFMNRHFDQGPTKRLSLSGGTIRGNYPFFSSQDIAFTPPPAGPQTFELCPDGPVEITVDIIAADTNQTIQTLRMAFPKAILQLPRFNAANATFNNRLSGNLAGGDWDRVVRDEDTVVSLEPAGTLGNDPAPSLPNNPDHTAGDMRMISALRTVDPKYFRAHNDYTTNVSRPNGKSHGMMSALGLRYPGATTGKLVAVTSYMGGGDRQPDVTSRVGNYVARVGGALGDWDTGMACHKDGAYLNKPDEGDEQFVHYGGGRRIPYMVKEDYFDAVGKTYFSPNRQIPSALMFGSIPTGVQRFHPWQTLLFQPAPEDTSHPGKVSPPDHLLADLFWMPVVEPYAISQPFSTAGKINMNYQIQPFTYIRRDTGMQAVLKSTKFLALQLSDANSYKPHIGSDTQSATIADRRLPINIPETLKAFDAKFANNEVFKSATQICEMNLVPPGQKQSTMAAFWGNGTTYSPTSRRLTGDNVREKPYADIYPRLTTKSNTYTVHFRVQALKKTAGTPHDSWVEGRDQVAAEYRGSTIIERYIDPNDPKLPDFAELMASNPNSPDLNIDQYYRFRVVSTKRFAP